MNDNQFNRATLERTARDVIQSMLSVVPSASIDITDVGAWENWDFTVQISTPLGHQIMLCEVKSRAWPNELHAFAHRMKESMLSSPEASIPVFIAPYISKQAAEIAPHHSMQVVHTNHSEYHLNCQLLENELHSHTDDLQREI